MATESSSAIKAYNAVVDSLKETSISGDANTIGSNDFLEMLQVSRLPPWQITIFANGTISVTSNNHA